MHRVVSFWGVGVKREVYKRRGVKMEDLNYHF